MKTADFDFNLPEDLIAQEPLNDRSASRLLVVNRNNSLIGHDKFLNLFNIIDQNYIMVFNSSRVIPARLKVQVNSAEAEVFLVKNITGNIWQCLTKPGKKFSCGKNFSIIAHKDNSHNLNGKVLKINDDGLREIAFFWEGDVDFLTVIEAYGHTPLPPYIKKTDQNPERYQTIYAQKAGSVAAPTAGLHFSNEILSRLKEKGIDQCFIDLQVGLGTFLPVKSEEVKDHKMHAESYVLSETTANILNCAKEKGKKILAVGTTSLRTLESCAVADKFGNYRLRPQSGETDIFIYPGYRFKYVDALLTNFHLPKSTLMMLISAFAGKKLIFDSYQEAIDNRYRFFSFGDAMLIL